MDGRQVSAAAIADQGAMLRRSTTAEYDATGTVPLQSKTPKDTQPPSLRSTERRANRFDQECVFVPSEAVPSALPAIGTPIGSTVTHGGLRLALTDSCVLA